MLHRACVHCGSSFDVRDRDLAFYDAVSPVIGGKKLLLPPPTFCPDCRFQRRAVWRNERTLFRVPCTLCRKETIAMYSEQMPVTIACNDCWWSDRWDPLSYGMAYDFSCSFFEQFQELWKRVPAFAFHQVANQENCDYTNYAGYNRNCYLLFNSTMNEDCLYSRGLARCRSCIDTYYGLENERCYECLFCTHCYAVLFAENCQECSDSSFLYDCIGCRHCFLCTNLRHKEYCFRNEVLSKEAYRVEVSKFHTGSFAETQKLLEEFAALKRNAIHKENHNINAEDCTGDYITSSKGCFQCFEVKNSEDCAYSDFLTLNSKTCQDVTGYGIDSEELFETMGVGRSFHVILSQHCSHSSGCIECFGCHHCRNCFGCTGLRHKEHCILNREYTKEEYEMLIPKIIEHMREDGSWGEFFPAQHSPFAYNETVAQDYMPLSKEEAMAQGFGWKEAEIQDSRLKTLETLWCECCGRSYRITQKELVFYQEIPLPIPRKCFECRHGERLTRKNPRKLWERPCATCGKAIQTTYGPERPERVFCASCYVATVY